MISNHSSAFVLTVFKLKTYSNYPYWHFDAMWTSYSTSSTQAPLQNAHYCTSAYFEFNCKLEHIPHSMFFEQKNDSLVKTYPPKTCLVVASKRPF